MQPAHDPGRLNPRFRGLLMLWVRKANLASLQGPPRYL